MKRGSPETKPYRVTGALVWAVGMLVFAYSMAYGGPSWLTAAGVVVAFSGVGVVLWGVQRFGPDA